MYTFKANFLSAKVCEFSKEQLALKLSHKRKHLCIQPDALDNLGLKFCKKTLQGNSTFDLNSS
jgi:hypothetical protein